MLTILLYFLLQVPYVTQIPPTADYQKWWNEMQTCSEVQKPFAKIRFYVVNDSTFLLKGSRYREGAADPQSQSIFMSKGKENWDLLVKHEMLHLLLGRPGHPQIPFASPCHVYVVDETFPR